MALIRLVGEVVEREDNVGALTSLQLDVRPCRDIQQRVGRCGGLRVVESKEVVLTEIRVGTKRHEQVVEKLAVTHIIVTELAVPPWSRRERKVFTLLSALRALRADVREGVLEMQRFPWMDVHHHFPAPQACVAARVGECRHIVDDDLSAFLICHLLQVDVMVNPVGE